MCETSNEYITNKMWHTNSYEIYASSLKKEKQLKIILSTPPLQNVEKLFVYVASFFFFFYCYFITSLSWVQQK